MAISDFINNGGFGLASFDRAKQAGYSEKDIYKYLSTFKGTVGDKVRQNMEAFYKEQNKPKTVSGAIRQAGADGITRQELQQIQKDTGSSMQKIIQQLDTVNKNLKEAEKQTIALNSGAANMLIKEASKAPAFNQPNFGTGNIGRALAGAIGTPEIPGVTIKGQQVGGTPGTPGTGLIPGGMMIRSGGRLAVRPQPMAAAPVNTAVETAPVETIPTEQTPTDVFQDPLTPYQTNDQEYLDLLNSLPDLFTQQMQGMFDPLQQAIDSLQQQQPLRLYGAGQNYNVGGVRSAMRRPQSRSNFLRNNMGIGGIATPGLTSSLSGLAGALGTLGGLTI